MPGDSHQPPAGAVQAPPHGRIGAPQSCGPSDQQSVPQAAPRPQSQVRAVGQGSVAGTLCADPELRFTNGGKSIAKLRVAVSERVQDPDTHRWVDGPTDYLDVNVWGKAAEHVTDHLAKGDRVVAVGTWNEETWTGRDGQQHSKRTFTARDIGPSVMFRAARVIRAKEGS